MASGNSSSCVCSTIGFERIPASGLACSAFQWSINNTKWPDGARDNGHFRLRSVLPTSSGVNGKCNDSLFSAITNEADIAVMDFRPSSAGSREPVPQ